MIEANRNESDVIQFEECESTTGWTLSVFKIPIEDDFGKSFASRRDIDKNLKIASHT